jgi:Zn-dependent protease with chaperone function
LSAPGAAWEIGGVPILIALLLAQAAAEPFPFPPDGEQLSKQAFDLFNERKPAEAEPLLRKLLELAPGNPRGYRQLGFALGALGRPQEAVTALNKAEELHVDAKRMPSLLIARAQAQLNLGGGVAAARKDLERAVAISSGDEAGEALYFLAAADARQGDLLEAEHNARRSIDKLQQNPAAHLLLAAIYAYQDERGKSREELELARAQGATPQALEAADERNRHAERMDLVWQVPLLLVAALLLGLACLYLAGAGLSKTEMRSLSDLKAGSAALQGEATAGERLVHRLYLAVLWFGTVFFYLSVPAMVIVSLAVSGGILYAMISANLLYVKLVIIVLIVAGGSVWAVLRSLFFTIGKGGDGIEVTEAGEPRLFAALREVSGVAGTRTVDKVYLELDATAAVREAGGALRVLLGRGERILHLGFWALSNLDESELKSILAHEYGHFSHGETRLTPILGRLKIVISLMLARMNSIGWIIVVNPSWWYLRGYASAFFAASAGESRRKELLADRVAALAYGGDAFGSALRKVIEADLVFDRYAGRVTALLRQSGRPCSELYRAVAAARAVEPLNTQAKVTEAALNRQEGEYDSHPAPADRIARVAGVPAAHPHAAGPALALLTDAQSVAHQLADRIRVNVEVHLAAREIQMAPPKEMAPEAQLWFAEGLALNEASEELARRRHPEANSYLQQAASKLRAALGDKDPMLVPLLSRLAQAHARDGKPEDARAAAEDGLGILELHPDPSAQAALRAVLSKLDAA